MIESDTEIEKQFAKKLNETLPNINFKDTGLMAGFATDKKWKPVKTFYSKNKAKIEFKNIKGLLSPDSIEILTGIMKGDTYYKLLVGEKNFAGKIITGDIQFGATEKGPGKTGDLQAKQKFNKDETSLNNFLSSILNIPRLTSPIDGARGFASDIRKKYPQKTLDSLGIDWKFFKKEAARTIESIENTRLRYKVFQHKDLYPFFKKLGIETDPIKIKDKIEKAKDKVEIEKITKKMRSAAQTLGLDSQGEKDLIQKAIDKYMNEKYGKQGGSEDKDDTDGGDDQGGQEGGEGDGNTGGAPPPPDGVPPVPGQGGTPPPGGWPTVKT